MKSTLSLFIAIFFTAALLSCKDDEKSLKGDPDLTHSGEEWTIASIEYNLIDQQTSGGIGQTVKSGTRENVGTFYFKEGGQGSFELVVDGYNKEDVFNFTIEGDQISVIEVSQSVGVKTNQNVMVLDGELVSDTERTLGGVISKQTPGGNFIMTLDVVLSKK